MTARSGKKERVRRERRMVGWNCMSGMNQLYRETVVLKNSSLPLWNVLHVNLAANPCPTSKKS
jgi:hypothetical protein